MSHTSASFYRDSRLVVHLKELSRKRRNGVLEGKSPFHYDFLHIMMIRDESIDDAFSIYETKDSKMMNEGRARKSSR